VLRKIEAEYVESHSHAGAISLGSVENRHQWLGDFGRLRVFVVDDYDIFVSKLSSRKEKHRLDLRFMALKLDRRTAKRRLLTDCRAYLDNPKLKPQVEENWRFIFQESLLADQDVRLANRAGRPSSHPKITTPVPGRAGRWNPRNGDTESSP
jgi:hypothetical protein